MRQHRVQLVAHDLHVGSLRTQLAPRLAQHRLAEAVVLPDQVDRAERRSSLSTVISAAMRMSAWASKRKCQKLHFSFVRTPGRPPSS
jgi:hypothetical protein